MFTFFRVAKSQSLFKQLVVANYQQLSNVWKICFDIAFINYYLLLFISFPHFWYNTNIRFHWWHSMSTWYWIYPWWMAESKNNSQWTMLQLIAMSWASQKFIIICKYLIFCLNRSLKEGLRGYQGCCLMQRC